MQQCLELAKKALGETYPNPMVGAVFKIGFQFILVVSTIRIEQKT